MRLIWWQASSFGTRLKDAVAAPMTNSKFGACKLKGPLFGT